MARGGKKRLHSSASSTATTSIQPPTKPQSDKNKSQPPQQKQQSTSSKASTMSDGSSSTSKGPAKSAAAKAAEVAAKAAADAAKNAILASQAAEQAAKVAQAALAAAQAEEAARIANDTLAAVRNGLSAPAPVPAPSKKNNSRRRGGKKKSNKQTEAGQQPQVPNPSVSQPSTINQIKQQATEQSKPTVPLPAKKQNAQQTQPKQGLASNKIKTDGDSNGKSDSINNNTRKDSKTITTNTINTGLTNKDTGSHRSISSSYNNSGNIGIKPQEPSGRNIIYLTNRAKLAAQAELIAEAVPFRLPYNSS